MNNNEMSKEGIQLLNDMSDDSASDDIQFALAPPPPPLSQVRRKIRTKRKPRKDLRNEGKTSSFQPCTLLSILKIASISFAVGGTIILGWVVVQLHTEVNNLTEKLASFPTSTDDESILALKRAVKELTLNETYNFKATQNCSKVVDLFQTQLSVFSLDLEGIKKSLKETPNMLNIGKELESLKSSLANFEATLSDLKLNLHDTSHAASSPFSNQLDILNATVQDEIVQVKEDLHHQHEILHELKNNTDQFSVQNLTALSERVDAVQSAIGDLQNVQKNVTATLSQILQRLITYKDSLQNSSSGP